MSSDEQFVEEVLLALRECGLEAIVVGSVAALLQGAPITTEDMDVLVRDTPKNREKLKQLEGRLGHRAVQLSPLARTLRIPTPRAHLDILLHPPVWTAARARPHRASPAPARRGSGGPGSHRRHARAGAATWSIPRRELGFGAVHGARAPCGPRSVNFYAPERSREKPEVGAQASSAPDSASASSTRARQLGRHTTNSWFTGSGRL